MSHALGSSGDGSLKVGGDVSFMGGQVLSKDIMHDSESGKNVQEMIDDICQDVSGLALSDQIINERVNGIIGRLNEVNETLLVDSIAEEPVVQSGTHWFLKVNIALLWLSLFLTWAYLFVGKAA